MSAEDQAISEFGEIEATVKVSLDKGEMVVFVITPLFPSTSSANGIGSMTYQSKEHITTTTRITIQEKITSGWYILTGYTFKKGAEVNYQLLVATSKPFYITAPE